MMALLSKTQRCVFKAARTIRAVQIRILRGLGKGPGGRDGKSGTIANGPHIEMRRPIGNRVGKRGRWRWIRKPSAAARDPHLDPPPFRGRKQVAAPPRLDNERLARGLLFLPLQGGG